MLAFEIVAQMLYYWMLYLYCQLPYYEVQAPSPLLLAAVSYGVVVWGVYLVQVSQHLQVPQVGAARMLLAWASVH